MENYKLVLPEHLNQFGYLFGGNLLKWVDETAWIAASLDFPGCKFVTVGMEEVEFRKSIKEGSILRFLVERVKIGNTSVQYSVNVFDESIKIGRERGVFSTTVTFVCLDEGGNKTSVVPHN
jgi:acyl-CoA hydrolase